MTDIYIFKLITGETLIASVINKDKNVYHLENPMIINEAVDDEMQQSAYVLTKYNVFDDTNISTLNKNHIVSISTVIDEMISYYTNSIEFNDRIINPKLKFSLRQVNKEMVRYMNEDVEDELELISTNESSKLIH